MQRRDLLALGLAALALPRAAAAAGEKVVNVYSSRHYGVDDALWRAFEAETGIRVRVVEGGHDELIQRLAAEGEYTPADVLVTVDAGRLAFAAARGLFRPVSSPALERAIPAHLRHPGGVWWGLAVRARILVHHTGRVRREELSTYEDLADPKWRGRILVRSSSNIYNISWVASMIAASGVETTERWCRGFVANFARPPQGGDTDQIEAVAAGVGDVAIVNHYYFARLQASEDADDRALVKELAPFFPNQEDRGVHVNVTGAAVTRHAPHPEAALRLLEFLAGPAGQRHFADATLEYPANPEVAPHPVLRAWGPFRQDTMNAARYAEFAETAVRLMDRCGWR